MSPFRPSSPSALPTTPTTNNNSNANATPPTPTPTPTTPISLHQILSRSVPQPSYDVMNTAFIGFPPSPISSSSSSGVGSSLQSPGLNANYQPRSQQMQAQIVPQSPIPQSSSSTATSSQLQQNLGYPNVNDGSNSSGSNGSTGSNGIMKLKLVKTPESTSWKAVSIPPSSSSTVASASAIGVTPTPAQSSMSTSTSTPTGSGSAQNNGTNGSSSSSTNHTLNQQWPSNSTSSSLTNYNNFLMDWTRAASVFNRSNNGSSPSSTIGPTQATPTPSSSTTSGATATNSSSPYMMGHPSMAMGMVVPVFPHWYGIGQPPLAHPYRILGRPPAATPKPPKIPKVTSPPKSESPRTNTPVPPTPASTPTTATATATASTSTSSATPNFSQQYQDLFNHLNAIYYNSAATMMPPPGSTIIPAGPIIAAALNKVNNPPQSNPTSSPAAAAVNPNPIIKPVIHRPASTSIPLPPPSPPSATLPKPPNWMTHHEDAHSSLESYKTFPVPKGSFEYMTLSDLCDPLKVESITQIHNPELWTRFVNQRKELFRLKSGDVDLLSQLGLEEKAVLRAAEKSFSWELNDGLASSPYSDNFALLFHCTRSKVNLDSILKQGLDERLGGGSTSTGGLLGRGIYFADNPSKSIQYDGGLGVILVFGVLLGDCLSVDHLPTRNTLVREPEKTKEQKRNSHDNFFDSIVGRPGGPNNEFVIYNRYQCVPMYMIKYQRLPGPVKVTASKAVALGTGIAAVQRQSIPPIAWTPQSGGTGLVMPNPGGLNQGAWAFHAKTIITQMGVKDKNEKLEKELAAKAAAEEAAKKKLEEMAKKAMEDAITLIRNLDTLASLGFINEAKNRVILTKYGGDLDQAVNFLLDESSPSQMDQTPGMAPGGGATSGATASATATTSTTTTPNTNLTVINVSDDDEEMEDSPPGPNSKNANKTEKINTILKNPPPIKPKDDPLPTELSDWALDFDLKYTHPTATAQSDLATPNTSTPSTSSGALSIVKTYFEQCPICYEEFPDDPSNSLVSSNFKVLTCSHQVCNGCHKQIEKVRVTMSGVTHTSVKCPFCAKNSGLEIGTCPNGTMRVSEVKTACSGYEGHSTFVINYVVNEPGQPNLSRTAYIPNTDEGRKILSLLKIAWDRRLCFTIGTSNTTGRENVLVWNIHHKTAISGGVASYGYPDPGYLDRVLWELKAYGIE